jgi:hypothetical protein
LLAADENGLVPKARRKRGYPYNQDTAAAQMRDIMEQAREICSAAKTDLSRALRLLTVHTDLSEHYPAAQARCGYFSSGQPVTNAIQVAGPLQVPECTILADLWVAAES